MEDVLALAALEATGPWFHSFTCGVVHQPLTVILVHTKEKPNTRVTQEDTF